MSGKTAFFLIVAIFISLFSACGAENGSGTSAVTEGSDERTGKTIMTDKPFSTESATPLAFDYVTTESPNGSDNPDDDIKIVTSREGFSALYAGKSGDTAAGAMAYFNDDFFENHVVVVFEISLPHFMVLHADSVEKKGDEIIVNYIFYSTEYNDFVISGHTGLLILSKDDYNGNAVLYTQQITYVNSETLRAYQDQFHQESLAALGKYKP